jgi:GntR family transcriptional repressor for pyruvate dehydrogenase complex
MTTTATSGDRRAVDRAAPSAARPGLPDQVVAQLLGAVAGGEHPPGSRLPPEAELASRANVSRLTLREAVKVLRDKGVLRVEQGRGTFVNPPARWSPLDPELLASRTALEGGGAGALADQLTEARTVVEVGVAGLAALRRTDDDLAALRGIVAEMQACHERGDVPSFSAADTTFHEAVLVAAANPILSALYEPIRTLVHQLRVTTACDPGVREQALSAHRAILDAVSAGDQEAAAQATDAHVHDTHRVVAEGHVDPTAAPPAPPGQEPA